MTVTSSIDRYVNGTMDVKLYALSILYVFIDDIRWDRKMK